MNGEPMSGGQMGGDPYRDWDASYLLDALSRTERAEYEDHLTGCATCREAVGELAGMTALLGRAKSADVTALLDAPQDRVPPGVFSRMSELAGAQPARTRPSAPRNWWTVVAVAAVLVLIVAAGAIIVRSIAVPPTGPPPAVVATAPEDPDSPIRAEVALYAEPWGTRVDMTCSYADSGRWADRAGKSWVYTMVVVAIDGSRVPIGTWAVDAGDTAHPSGTTDLPVDRIKAVEIHSARGKVLLTIPVR